MYDSKVIVNSIDRDFVLSGIVLHGSSQETVCEEELVDPVHFGDAVIDPGLEEIQAVFQVLDVTSQRLQGWETCLQPQSGDLTVKHLDHGMFHFLGHKDLTNNGAFKVFQESLNTFNEAVEPTKLLS